LLRALNRLHDLTPGAKVAGQILLEGTDIYRGDITVTELRTRVGMVFQRPILSPPCPSTRTRSPDCASTA